MLDLQSITKAIQNSDTDAFKRLFDAYQQPLYHFIYSKVYNMELSEDILQDVFVTMWEKRHTLRADSSIQSLLYTIANNLALNALRHKKVRLGSGTEDSDAQLHHHTPDVILEKKESDEQFERALKMLPEQTRTVFMMSRYDDLTYQEIAQRLQISVKTVEAHMGKALKLLRAALKK